MRWPWSIHNLKLILISSLIFLQDSSNTRLKKMTAEGTWKFPWPLLAKTYNWYFRDLDKTLTSSWPQTHMSIDIQISTDRQKNTNQKMNVEWPWKFQGPQIGKIMERSCPILRWRWPIHDLKLKWICLVRFLQSGRYEFEKTTFEWLREI